MTTATKTITDIDTELDDDYEHSVPCCRRHYLTFPIRPGMIAETSCGKFLRILPKERQCRGCMTARKIRPDHCFFCKHGL